MTRVRSLLATAAVLLVPSVLIASGGPLTTQAAPADGQSFLETFDLDPAAPVNFSETSFSERWHVSHTVSNYQAWEDGDPVDAQHASDCGAPPATHRADTWDEYVYICKNHLMTARAAPSYGLTYLMPLAQVDLSGPEATISWDVSTESMSARDWIDMWVTPIDDVLMAPVDTGSLALQGSPKTAIQVRGGNSSERWIVSVIEDLQVVSSKTLYVPSTFERSARTRTTMTLRVLADSIEFTMDGVGSVTVPVGPGFDRGLIQWGQHSYNPTKDNAGVPATWHWDNFAFEPALDIGVSRVAPTRSFGKPDDTNELTFDRTTVDGDQLLFDAVCRVEADLGNGFELLDKQPASRDNKIVEAQSSYRVPVPAGMDSLMVRFQGDGWYDGWPCVLESPIIVNDTPPGAQPATEPAQVARPTAVAGDGEVQLSWSAPDDGGSPITDYDVLMRVDGGYSWVDRGTTTATELTVSGLTNGVLHEFWVRAENDVGTGLLSAKATATPLGSEPPAQVARPTAVAGDGEVQLSWSAPDDGGSPITDYDVLMRVDGGYAWVDGGTTTATELTVSGLTNGVLHEFWVRAENVAGTGPLSPKAVATPTAP